MDKSLNCIHLARAIKDRYEDATRMPADELEQMKALNKEATRLRQLAETEKEHADLESWAASPDGAHPALSSKAGVDAAVAAATGGHGDGPMVEFSKRQATAMFAKALRKGPQVLTMEEK